MRILLGRSQKRADYVHMDVRKSARNQYWVKDSGSLQIVFRPGTVLAVPAPIIYVPGHISPDPSSGEEGPGGLSTGVA